MKVTIQNVGNRILRMTGKICLSSHSAATRHRAKPGTHSEEGASIVEFAFATTILFAIIFGILQMSLALYTYHFTSDAAREGTRWAIVRGSVSCTNTPGLTNCNASTADIATFIKGLGYPGIDSSKITVTTTFKNPDNTVCTIAPCNAPGNSVQTRVSYAFPLRIPFSTSSTLNVGSTSMMTISQ